MRAFILLSIIQICTCINVQRTKNTLQMNDFEYAITTVEHNFVGYYYLQNTDKQILYNDYIASLRKQIDNKSISAFDAVGLYLSWFNCAHLRTCWDDHAVFQKSGINYPELFTYRPQKVARKVDSDTFLIRFPSCDGTDPNMRWIHQAIKDYKKSHCKYIIIDIRGNGGGSDKFYKPILKLLYDTPAILDGADFFYTKDNLKQMRKYFPLRTIFRSLTNKNNHERVIWPFFNDFKIRFLSKSKYPIAAAVIIDNNVASSGEQMILEIKATSKRTIIYGKDNTLGCIDISNCRPVILPDCGHTIVIPMTISHRLPYNEIDPSGITPDIYIPIPYPKELTNNIDEWSIWVSNDLKMRNCY